MDMIELFIAAAVGIFIGWSASKKVHLDGFRQLLRALKVTEEDLLRAMIRIQSKEWQLDEDEGTTPTRTWVKEMNSNENFCRNQESNGNSSDLRGKVDSFLRDGISR
jgi:hypothetical protein